MGCGSSKAVVAPNNAVTIKKSDAGSSSVKAQSPPTSPQSHKADDNTEEEERSSSADLARNQSGLSSKPVLGPIPRGASDGESSSALGVNSPIVEGSTGEEGIRKPVSFEVAFSSNGEPVTKKPPRRLQKLESATTLTAEALEKKQKAVEERKKQELDKKTKHLSKKERLRKEIRDAREFEKAQQQYTTIEQRQSSSELNRAKAREEIREKQKKREEHAKKVKTRRGSTSDSVVESMSSTLEADSLFNADNMESTWDNVGGNKKKDDNANTTTAMTDSNDDLFSEQEDKTDYNFTGREHEVVM